MASGNRKYIREQIVHFGAAYSVLKQLQQHANADGKVKLTAAIQAISMEIEQLAVDYVAAANSQEPMDFPEMPKRGGL